MTFTNSLLGFFPLTNGFKPNALARLPVSIYSNLNTSTHIPWIWIQISDRKLLCRVVPAVADDVEYVEASSNLWIPFGDSLIRSQMCKIGGYIKKSKLAEKVELEGDEEIDNYVLFMRANLVHKLICKGLHIKISLDDSREVVFRVKTFISAGGSSDLDEFVIVAPQTNFTFVPKETAKIESAGEVLTCPAGLEGPFRLISDLLDPRIITKMREINVSLPRGVLMSGPPGVGKTFLVKHIAESSRIPLIVVNGPELISPVPGESETNLIKLFEEARRAAEGAQLKCSIIFFDEIDAIAKKRESDSMEGISEVRLLTQLLTLMDGFDGKLRGSREDCHVIIFAATNRPNSLDPAMRRPGRFDREIVFEPPDASARTAILTSLLKAEDFEFEAEILDEIGRNCAGFVSADLAALAQEAIFQASKRSQEFQNKLCREDFVAAMKIVGPSLHRQYQVALDNRVTWNDIAGIDEIRDKLKRFIEWPLLYPEAYARMGLCAPRGVLLYGPPGCSKTTIAKAIANESGFTFYSLNGAALYSCYIGESEQQIRDVFQCARLTSPSVIFFDEIDALVGKRSNEFGVSSGDAVQERILSTILNEMDGITASGNVLVVGATNRKDLIDEALLRPGRFDKHIYIPPPSEKGRLEILRLFLRDKKIDESVNLEELAKRTEKFTGADLKGLVQEAAILAMYDESFTFKMDHFLRVLASPGRKRNSE